MKSPAYECFVSLGLGFVLILLTAGQLLPVGLHGYIDPSLSPAEIEPMTPKSQGITPMSDDTGSAGTIISTSTPVLVILVEK